MFALEIDKQIPLGGFGGWRRGATEPRGRKGRAKEGGGDGGGGTREDKKLNGVVKAVKENTSAA